MASLANGVSRRRFLSSSRIRPADFAATKFESPLPTLQTRNPLEPLPSSGALSDYRYDPSTQCMKDVNDPRRELGSGVEVSIPHRKKDAITSATQWPPDSAFDSRQATSIKRRHDQFADLDDLNRGIPSLYVDMYVSNAKRRRLQQSQAIEAVARGDQYNLVNGRRFSEDNASRRALSRHDDGLSQNRRAVSRKDQAPIVEEPNATIYDSRTIASDILRALGFVGPFPTFCLFVEPLFLRPSSLISSFTYFTSRQIILTKPGELENTQVYPP